ncbi:MAG: S9 family peptidase, partial [Planctomycetota bacterium]
MSTTKRHQKNDGNGSGQRLITPEDLKAIRYLSDPQISPDGRSMLFTQREADPDKPKAYRTNIWISDLDGDDITEPRQLTYSGKDQGARWSPDGSRIAFVSRRLDSRPQIFVLDYAAGGEAQAVTELPEGSIGHYLWSPDGSRIAFAFREQHAHWTEDAKKKRGDANESDPPRIVEDWWYRLDGDGYFLEQRYSLRCLDLDSREVETLYTEDTLGWFDFDWSPEGDTIVIATNRDAEAMVRPWNSDLILLDVATRKLTPIDGLPEGPKGPVKWSPDGGWIAYGGREGEDDTYSTENYQLYICTPDGSTVRNLLDQTDYCLAAATLSDTAEVAFSAVFEWGRNSKGLFLQIGWHGECHVASVAVSGRGNVKMLTEGKVVHSLGNVSRSRNRLAMTVDTVNSPPEIAVGDAGSGLNQLTVRRVTNQNKALLDELHLATIEEHWVDVPGCDDAGPDHPMAKPAKVHTWVMRPPSATSDDGPRPGILEIHGGPHTQYGVGFFHEFQVLAAAGYTVVFSNPRGSKGYGRDHCAAIRGHWGGADWEDIRNVGRFMQSLPDVDAKRCGIMGGSYGGYMTNWAIGHTDEYAGAITDRCV